MCTSKEKPDSGHRHKDALPKKGSCTCREAGEIQQGAYQGTTAVEPPPVCRKKVHCLPERIQVGLVQTIRKMLGAAPEASPLNTSCQLQIICVLGFNQWRPCLEGPT